MPVGSPRPAPPTPAPGIVTGKPRPILVPAPDSAEDSTTNFTKFQLDANRRRQLTLRTQLDNSEANRQAKRAGFTNTPKQTQPRVPIFSRASVEDLLAGGIPGLGLLNALTIGGVPGALTSQGVGRGRLSLRKPKNARK